MWNVGLRQFKKEGEDEKRSLQLPTIWSKKRRIGKNEDETRGLDFLSSAIRFFARNFLTDARTIIQRPHFFHQHDEVFGQQNAKIAPRRQKEEGGNGDGLPKQSEWRESKALGTGDWKIGMLGWSSFSFWVVCGFYF